MNSINSSKVVMYTPEQVAEILQLSKATVYQLISKGEIIAKRIGKAYRIPRSSIFYAFSGLDNDLYQAQQEDLKNINQVESQLKKVRAKI